MSDPFKNKWEKLILQLPALDDTAVRRNCFPPSDNGQVIEFHRFSDPSTKPYAAAMYGRVVEEDVTHTTLLRRNTNHSTLGAFGSSSSGSFDEFSNKVFFGQCFSSMLDSKSASLEAICYATCRRAIFVS